MQPGDRAGDTTCSPGTGQGARRELLCPRPKCPTVPSRAGPSRAPAVTSGRAGSPAAPRRRRRFRRVGPAPSRPAARSAGTCSAAPASAPARIPGSRSSSAGAAPQTPPPAVLILGASPELGPPWAAPVPARPFFRQAPPVSSMATGGRWAAGGRATPAPAPG